MANAVVSVEIGVMDAPRLKDDHSKFSKIDVAEIECAAGERSRDCTTDEWSTLGDGAACLGSWPDVFLGLRRDLFSRHW
jgi:hypothetical protein